ncbi:MAG: tetratricopeptide repeat protein, partial [Thermodesulfobacteriota bacterium]|nr:tetratricopeptide repeat protein [Thermodesulfobacteriota bacterium]
PELNDDLAQDALMCPKCRDRMKIISCGGAYQNLGIYYANTGNLDKAKIEFKKAIDLNPYNKEGYFNLGNCYLTGKKYQESLLLYKKALRIYPDYAKAHNNIAVCYFFLKDYKSSVFHMNQAIKLGFNVNEQFFNALWPYQNK